MTAPPRSRYRWYTPWILAAGVAAILVYWVAASANDGREVAAYGGTYVEAATGAPQRVNPLYSGRNQVDDDLSALVFSGLTRLAPDGRVIPDLAESWEISDDGTQYTFTLRNGVVWHDGEELTANDVVFTWSILNNEEFDGDPGLTSFWQTVSAESVGDLGVRFTLEEPFAPFLAQTTIGIVPAHLLAGIPVEELSSASFNVEPVGSGPYRLDELTTREASLSANSSFHLGAPYISNIRLDFYPDRASAATAVRNSDADGTYVETTGGEGSLGGLGDDKRLHELVANNYTMLYLNWQLPAFQDDTVRRAIAFALDRQSITDDTLSGNGVITDSVITPGSWAWTDAFAPYDHDPGRAEALLDDAGWLPRADGVREREGIALEFELVTNNDSTRTAIASQIVRDLEAIGISVTLTSSGGNLYEDVLQPHRFEMALFGFAGGPDPDPFPAWHGSQIDGGANIPAYQDPVTDDELAQARLSADNDRRAELYLRFQQTFYERQPSVVIFYPVNVYVLPDELQGVEETVALTAASRFHNVWEWFLETDRVAD
jgi:peptide/nickel transport system substrate-binding protein